ncbi:phosphatidylinositol mannoside acyltransferase [Ornithinicoccus halotolerans]|uniref:phosphatidylinositol mannoside acyltransferase n=1 Tax=Ornithinicoccus halotolerans TaxID=1748220 RepID=UPI001295ABD2|nr:phosphatidylinositol mannoside acyltransferase [Ornithinicoccus halotolerans]
MTPAAAATPADRAASLAVRVGLRMARLLPERATYRAARWAADRVHRRDGQEVQQLRRTYAAVRPELDAAALEELVRAGLRSYARYWVDVFRLPALGPADLAARVRTVGDAAPRGDLAEGRGVVLFLGHLGNWDTCGAWATHHFAPVTTVAERLHPASVYEAFLRHRRSLGMTIYPLGEPGLLGILARAARAGECVPLLADRDLTGDGVVVRLCGQPVRMARGPAAIALATGTALYPVSVHYEPGPSGRDGPHRVVIDFGPRAELTDGGTGDRAEQLQALTQQCADHLGRTVAAHTEDWHVLQPVLLAQTEGDRCG